MIKMYNYKQKCLRKNLRTISGGLFTIKVRYYSNNKKDFFDLDLHTKKDNMKYFKNYTNMLTYKNGNFYFYSRYILYFIVINIYFKYIYILIFTHLFFIIELQKIAIKNKKNFIKKIN
jgi:hypothetical protein